VVVEFDVDEEKPTNSQLSCRGHILEDVDFPFSLQDAKVQGT
jgi:hypothetical protein